MEVKHTLTKEDAARKFAFVTKEISYSLSINVCQAVLADHLNLQL
jgi:hypothetical protein